ncbi:MAG TPA: hypothetical protein VM537_13565 [Anaerolineae bacterium]|nr:hypothetical protein [Anaerolineae bacterium]
MKRLILGFGYKRRSGKDSCGEYAVKHMQRLGKEARIDWFALSLKHMCGAAFEFTTPQLWGEDKLEVDEFWNITPARAMQLCGTECMRKVFGDDFWVRTLERRVKTAVCSSFVICDVRFPNEAEAVRSWGGHLVRVDRPGLADVVDGRDPAHESETALDNYDGWNHVLVNDGSLEELHTKVADLVDSLL